MKALQYHVHKLSKEKSVYNRFSRCSTITSTEFAIFVLDAKHFNTLAIYCGKHYNIRIHTMARGHTVHYQQAILLMAFPIYFVWRMRRN